MPVCVRLFIRIRLLVHVRLHVLAPRTNSNSVYTLYTAGRNKSAQNDEQTSSIKHEILSADMHSLNDILAILSLRYFLEICYCLVGGLVKSSSNI